jgi:hypothetical protein
MISRHIRRISLLTLLGVFFAQFALAAYACRLVEVAAAEQGASDAMPPQCEEMGVHGESMSVLCAEHCHAEPAMLSGEPDAAPMLAPLLQVLIRVLPASEAGGTRRSDAPASSGAAPPPLLALYGRLRL